MSMNRYLKINIAVYRERQAKRQNPNKWYEYDWSHWDDNRTTVNRPTEDQALQNVYDLAYVMRHTGEITAFDDNMWIVYFTDLELRFKWTNSQVYNAEIGKLIGFTPERVAATLHLLDNVCDARAKLGLPVIPPIPIKHLHRMKRVKKLATEKKIQWAA